jgi:SH3-like domain-containing protein
MIKRCAILILAFWWAGSGAAWAERLAVDAPIANIRSGPGTEHAVVWKIERYHPLEIVEQRGEWCRFQDFENDQGWIHRSLLKKIDAVITVKEPCNIRSGPGTDYGVVFTVGAGVPFRVLERRGGWLHVEHADGDKGWIAGSLVW